MRILLIGYSRIARRRVIPAVRAVAPAATVCVASRSTADALRIPEFTWFHDYAEAIEHGGADLAYISLTNDAHAEWTARALSAGLHVIVDKPAFVSVADAARLVALARERRRLLAEATVFAFHPQFQHLKSVMAPHEEDPRRVVAVFSFPALPESDFRNQPHLGGGALWDVGPYAVATDRVIFDTPPDRIHAEVVSRGANGMVTGFSILFSHGAKGALTGHFGFGTEYQNWLCAFGRDFAVSLRRAFTTTPETAPVVDVQSRNVSCGLDVPAADAFAEFLRAVFHAIEIDDIDTFAGMLWRDAVLLDRLKNALTEG